MQPDSPPSLIGACGRWQFELAAASGLNAADVVAVRHLMASASCGVRDAWLADHEALDRLAGAGDAA